MIVVTKKSILTGKENSMSLPLTEREYEQGMFDRDVRGKLIQDVFPQLSPSEREFLINGVTPEEWKANFG